MAAKGPPGLQRNPPGSGLTLGALHPWQERGLRKIGEVGEALFIASERDFPRPPAGMQTRLSRRVLLLYGVLVSRPRVNRAVRAADSARRESVLHRFKGRKEEAARPLYAKWVRVTGAVLRQSSVRLERGSPCWGNAPHQHGEPGGSAFALCPTPSPRPPGRRLGRLG